MSNLALVYFSPVSGGSEEHLEKSENAGKGFSPQVGENQKNPLSVRKIRVRNSGAGNGCANFMDTWKNAFFLQENPCP